MKKFFWFLLAIIIGTATVILVPFLVSWLWAWIVPDLFPRAVMQGLVARTISWFTGLKILIVLAIIGAFTERKTIIKKR